MAMELGNDVEMSALSSSVAGGLDRATSVSMETILSNAS